MISKAVACVLIPILIANPSLVWGQSPAPESPAASPGEVIVVPAPDPALDDHTAIVQAAVALCAGKENVTLQFSPGTYYLSPFAANAPEGGLKFIKLRGLTVDGRGAVLMMKSKLTPLYFKDCDGVTVKDVTVDSVKPFFAQGKVIAGTENSLDIEIDPAFPLAPEEKVMALMDYDPQTRLPLANLDVFSSSLVKEERPDTNHVHIEFRRSGNPAKREHLAKWLPASVGKLVVLRTEIHGHYGLTFTRCRDVLLERVTVYSSAGMCLHTQECENITSRSVQLRIKPGSGRLMSSTIDCQYYTFSKGTIRIEDGYYEGMGDDGCNVTAKYRQVVAFESDNVFTAALPGKLGWIGAKPVPGEKLTFQKVADMSTVGTWTVKDCTYDAAAKQFRITMEEPIKQTVSTGDLWYSETYLPKLEIRRSTFRGMRARGILLSTRNVLIENCKIESPGYCGIFFKGGLRHGYEGPVPSDVTIRYNSFEGCGGAGVYAYADNVKVPAGALKGIRIEDNIFRENPALAAQRFKQDNPQRMHWSSAIGLLSTKDAIIRGNTFEGYPVAVYLNNCADVQVNGNRSAAASTILREKTATNVQVGENTSLTLTDAPSGTLPDLEYLNDFR